MRGLRGLILCGVAALIAWGATASATGQSPDQLSLETDLETAHCRAEACVLAVDDGEDEGFQDDTVVLLQGVQVVGGAVEHPYVALGTALQAQGAAVWLFPRSAESVPAGDGGVVPQSATASTDDILQICIGGACTAVEAMGTLDDSELPDVRWFAQRLLGSASSAHETGAAFPLGAPPSSAPAPPRPPSLVDLPSPVGPTPVGASDAAPAPSPPRPGVPEPGVAVSAFAAQGAGTASAGAASAALAVPFLAGALGARLLTALYARLRSEDALRSPPRSRLYDAIVADPGCTIGTVARRLGVDYKTAQHHVGVLRRARLVLLEGPGQQRLFAAGSSGADERRAAVVLRGPGARQVLEAAAQGPLQVRRLAAQMGVAPSTVSRHVARLRAAGLLAPET